MDCWVCFNRGVMWNFGDQTCAPLTFSCNPSLASPHAAAHTACCRLEQACFLRRGWGVAKPATPPEAASVTSTRKTHKIGHTPIWRDERMSGDRRGLMVGLVGVNHAG